MLYTGRLEKYKNVHQVIYCLPQLIKKYPQKNIHYTIIGDGPYRKKLEKIIAKAGVEKYVSITGFAPSQQELIKSYKRADVFVSVSNTESFGMTIIEALAAGTPVIISDSPPIKHIVNGNGFVLTDLHQLSEKIEYIMTNTINVNFDVEPYTWNSIERQTTQIYF
ncbi:MAG: glycosyltransferase [candidate division KSB1 bacterium]|nr:glycosyltransferase [candidate division KSB1 bacterium]